MLTDELALPLGLKRRLRDAGLADTAGLISMTPRALGSLPGFGPMSVRRIEEALAQMKLGLAEDIYAPYTCARHGQPAFDAKLLDLWLCDACAVKLAGVFGGRPPEYQGQSVGGSCENCAEPKSEVRFRQWFLCDGCARVAKSFGKSLVAALSLRTYWSQHFEAQLGVRLVETDAPQLRPWSAGRSTKEPKIDFKGVRVGGGQPVFGIEMKTGQKGVGRGSLNPMGEFQLDCSDCDDIAAVAERDRLLVYLLHVQVIERATPPTRRFVAVDYWWADPFTMSSSCRDVRRRPREVRNAAYFDPSMFQELGQMGAHLAGGGAAALAARVAAEGRFPPLYPGQRVAGGY
jgi:ribosomal protein L37AE/L43A